MEILKKLRVSRRFALQGAVSGIGVSLWLPILESMCNDHATAFAQGQPIPTSFGIFFRGNGYYPPDWTVTRTVTSTASGDSWELLYGVTEIAEPQSHIMTDFRIVLMGHAGGQLPGNRHVRLEGRKVTELMLTMQQVMGVPVTTYGSWDRTSKTMPEILA
jgi:hypothetical protein